MQFRKGTPGEGREQTAEQFAYTEVPAGLKAQWSGWVAGEPYWCKAHEHKPPGVVGTKVCVEWFSFGSLICPRCKPAVLPSDICYVPVYRETDHKACLVICHETVADLLAGLDYGTRVIIGRVERGASVFVRRAETQVPFVTSQKQRQAPCDLRLTLLTIWGYPQLTMWLKTTGRTTEPECKEAKPEPVKSDGKGFDPFHRNAAIRYGSGEPELSLEATHDAAREVLRKAQKASANGKHKPGG